MGKRTRIVLYALSLVILLAMVTLIIFSWGKQHSEPVNDAMSETVISSTEEPIQIPEAEKRMRQTGRMNPKRHRRGSNKHSRWRKGQADRSREYRRRRQHDTDFCRGCTVCKRL